MLQGQTITQIDYWIFLLKNKPFIEKISRHPAEIQHIFFFKKMLATIFKMLATALTGVSLPPWVFVFERLTDSWSSQPSGYILYTVGWPGAGDYS